MFLDVFSLLFGSVRIEVAPEALFNTSDEILSQVSTIKNRFENISNVVQKTSSYWNGDVSEDERNFYNKKKGAITEALENIKTYSVEVKSIAQNYVNVEAEASNVAAQLPTNILS